MKVCAEPGCPTLTRTTRCPEHTRQRDRARGTRQQRGYDAAYDRLRAEWQRRLDAGERVTCWRCAAQGRPHTVDPTAWHFGHCDDDRRVYHGPECAAGNQATAGRKGCPHPSHADISPGA